ncbi:serine/threonine-protein kinase A-Raf-like isoform X2 [Sycon ciliatum]|uniref:serine/threonine-protein kinase A-Raf-like isoform X2 n=1 Tax=Sycon ciliatum TaxID=27933 RepID=UPI0020AD3D20|eukprot:scpid37191/ scgid0953/ Ephrin type-A receptor 3; EPH-like kinase 4; Tyrosine-protein kinase receptor ETK1
MFKSVSSHSQRTIRSASQDSGVMSADLESQAAGHSCEAAANPSNSRPPSPSPRRQWPWSMNSSSVSIPDEHTATDNEFFATVVPNSLINLTADEKVGYLEKCKIHMLTRTRKHGTKFYFRLTRAYFQFHDNDKSSVPKRCEVRLKISRVTSTKGSGFDVHFRNGNTWHLAAGNLIEKIEWMEALLPGSFPAKDRASVICADGIPGPADLESRAEVTSNTSTDVGRDADKDSTSAASAQTSGISTSGISTFGAIEEQKSDFSLDSDPELLNSILDEVDAMALTTHKSPPPPLPPDDRYAVPAPALKKPTMHEPLGDYMRAADESGIDYMDPNYEDHDRAGMVGDSLVELKDYALPLRRETSISSVSSTSSPSPLMPKDSIKFLRVAQERKEVLHTQLRSTSKLIEPGQVLMKRLIGKGAFGSVHLAEWSFRVSCAPVEVAVKCLKDGADEKAEKDFLAEARIMAEFDHPNIIRLFGVVDDGAARIVTEYMSNGNLKDFLEQVRTTDPMLRSRGQLVQYIVDIAGGLQYLATEGFIHRDLAARNVLVSEDERCKITDFGLSRKLEEDTSEYMSTGGLLPLKWTAPEAGLEKCFTTSSDVWSLGVTMWEVMTYGKKPYASLSFLTLFPALQRGVRLGKPRDCPDELYDLMKSCWEWEREQRPTCETICEQLRVLLEHEHQDTDDEDSPQSAS